MKNMFKYYFILSIISFLLTRCSEDNGISSNIDLPAIGEYEILIEFHHDVIGLFSANEIDSSFFILSGYNMSINEWNYYEFRKEWGIWIDKDEIPIQINYSLGSDLSFELKINKNHFIGDIHLPEKPIAHWPEFNFDEDYSFSWVIEKKPAFQEIWLDVFDNSKDVFEVWELDGEARNKTIPRKYYKNLDKNELYFYVDIFCYSIFQNGKNFAIAESQTGNID